MNQNYHKRSSRTVHRSTNLLIISFYLNAGVYNIMFECFSAAVNEAGLSNFYARNITLVDSLIPFFTLLAFIRVALSVSDANLILILFQFLCVCVFFQQCLIFVLVHFRFYEMGFLLFVLLQ